MLRQTAALAAALAGRHAGRAPGISTAAQPALAAAAADAAAAATASPLPSSRSPPGPPSTSGRGRSGAPGRHALWETRKKRGAESPPPRQLGLPIGATRPQRWPRPTTRRADSSDDGDGGFAAAATTTSRRPPPLHAVSTAHSEHAAAKSTAMAEALAAGRMPPPPPGGGDPLRPFLVARRMAAAPSATAARELMSLALAAGMALDPRHFTLLASRFGQEADPAGVRAVISAASAAGLAPYRQWYTSLIAAHGRRRDVAGARSAHRELDALFGSDERSVAALVSALAAVGRAGEAVETVAALRARAAGDASAGVWAVPALPATGLRPTLRTYTALLCAHAEAKDTAGARATLAAMAADGVDAAAARPQRALLRLYTRVGDERAARAALAAIAAASPPHHTANEADWASLASLVAERAGPEGVHAVLAEADEAGSRPGTACFTALVYARAGAGDAAGADAAAVEMRARGVPLSRYTYGALIQAHARRGDFASAEAAHREQAADPCAGPDPVSDAALVEAACQAWWNGGRARPALLSAAWQTALRLRVVDPGRLFPTRLTGGRVVPGGPGRAPVLLPVHAVHPWATAARWGGGRAAAVMATPRRAWRGLGSGGSGSGEETNLHSPFVEVDIHHSAHWPAQLGLLAALDRLLVAGWRRGASFVPPTPAAHAQWAEAAAARAAATPALHVITGIGRRSRTRHTSVVRHAAIGLLHRLGLPVKLAPGNEGVVVVAGPDLARLFAECDAACAESSGGGSRRGWRRLLPTHCPAVLMGEDPGPDPFRVEAGRGRTQPFSDF